MTITYFRTDEIINILVHLLPRDLCKMVNEYIIDYYVVDKKTKTLMDPVTMFQHNENNFISYLIDSNSPLMKLVNREDKLIENLPDPVSRSGVKFVGAFLTGYDERRGYYVFEYKYNYYKLEEPYFDLRCGYLAGFNPTKNILVQAILFSSEPDVVKFAKMYPDKYDIDVINCSYVTMKIIEDLNSDSMILFLEDIITNKILKLYGRKRNIID